MTAESQHAWLFCIRDWLSSARTLYQECPDDAETMDNLIAGKAD